MGRVKIKKKQLLFFKKSAFFWEKKCFFFIKKKKHRRRRFFFFASFFFFTPKKTKKSSFSPPQILTPPLNLASFSEKKRFFFQKKALLFCVFFCNFDTPHYLFSSYLFKMRQNAHTKIVESTTLPVSPNHATFNQSLIFFTHYDITTGCYQNLRTFGNQRSLSILAAAQLGRWPPTNNANHPWPIRRCWKFFFDLD